MHDIIANPENYYFLQFSTNTKKQITPLRVAPCVVRQSVRFPNYPPFATPKASSYGFRIHPDATHIGVVYSPNDDTVEMLFHVKISTLARKKAVAPFNNGTELYVNMSASKANLSIYISSLAKILKNSKLEDPKLAKFNAINFD